MLSGGRPEDGLNAGHSSRSLHPQGRGSAYAIIQTSIYPIGGIEGSRKRTSGCSLAEFVPFSTIEFAMPSLPEVEAREVWVNVTEAAQMIGYNREYLKKLIMQIWKLPEEQRPIQMHKRSNGFDLWFPDLVAYLREFGHGPYKKPNTTP